MFGEFDDFDTEIQCDENPNLADWEAYQEMLNLSMEDLEAAGEIFDKNCACYSSSVNPPTETCINCEPTPF
jgi:hypothetical protein